MIGLVEQISQIEATLERLKKRLPDLPVVEILTLRLLVHLGREFVNMFDQLLRPYGLNETEFRTLMAVHGAPNATASPGELCVGLGHSPANVTRITDALVERGLLLRLSDTQDRRRLTLKLTAQSEALINEIQPSLTTIARANYQQFPAEELQQLQTSLKKLAAAVDHGKASRLSGDSVDGSGASS